MKRGIRILAVAMISCILCIGMSAGAFGMEQDPFENVVNEFNREYTQVTCMTEAIHWE